MRVPLCRVRVFLKILIAPSPVESDFGVAIVIFSLETLPDASVLYPWFAALFGGFLQGEEPDS